MKGGGKGREAEEAEAGLSPGLPSSSSASFPSVKKMRRRRPVKGGGKGREAEEAEAGLSPGLPSSISFSEENEAEETGERGG